MDRHKQVVLEKGTVLDKHLPYRPIGSYAYKLLHRFWNVDRLEVERQTGNVQPGKIAKYVVKTSTHTHTQSVAEKKADRQERKQSYVLQD